MKYRVKNWDKFQHYKPKNASEETKKMPWFKLYGTDLLDDFEFNAMTHDQQILVVKLWCLASQFDGYLPEDSAIAYRLRYPITFINSVMKSIDKWIIEIDYAESILDRDRDLDRDTDKTLRVVRTSNRFIDFWNEYPNVRKTNKKGCLEKWKAKDLDLIADKVIGYVKSMKETKSWKEGFVPAPMTLLNQERYNDNNEPIHIRKVWEGGI